MGKNNPETPKRIERQRAIAAVQALGLDPHNVRAVHLYPDTVIAEVVVWTDHPTTFGGDNAPARRTFHTEDVTIKVSDA